MEIHFYENGLNLPITTIIGWRETEQAINSNAETIFTTQMGFLSTRLFDLGYRIFIHPNEYEENEYDFYEIKLGDNERTSRYIRMSHNLFKLWRAGEFN